MRTTLTCPKCSCRKLFKVDKMVHNGEYAGGDALSVTYANVPPRPGTKYTGDWANAGTFEAWVCSGCGFTELYARDANDALALLSQNPAESGVHLIDGNVTRARQR